MKQDEYLIQELADETGVSTRTIRFYQQEGLLPEPVNRGKYAYYTNDHLERLKLIQELKSNFLPLKEIRDRLNSLNTEQVQALLETQKSTKPKPSPTGEQSKNGLVQTGPDSAVEYIARLLQNQPDKSILAPGKDPSQSPRHATPQQYVSGSPSESWRRILIAPGIEIQVKEPLSPRDQKRLEELIKFARRLFL